VFPVALAQNAAWRCGARIVRGVDMRRLRGRLSHLALLMGLLFASPAVCEEHDDDEGWDEEAEQSALSRYGSDVGNRFLMGVNSVLTFPADPVMGTIEPVEEFAALPAGRVTRYVAGFGQGILLGAYRAVAGALDIVFAPLTPFAMLSPEPRYMLFEGVEHEAY
jgi:hypothetical protein